MKRLVDRLVRFKLGKTPRDQDASLEYVVRQAARHVPYYAERFRAVGEALSRVTSVSDLGQLPICDRVGMLRSGHAGHLRAGCCPDRLVRRRTSGTTGEPLTVFASRTEVLYRKVSLIDSLRRCVRLRLPLRLVDVGAYKGHVDWAQRLGLVQIERLYRTTPIVEQVDRVSRLRLDIVQGRPSSLWALAVEAQRRDVPLPRPRAVITFGEMLHDHVREAVGHAFGAPVFDYYNCEEIGNVAWECPEGTGRMHVNDDTAVVEIVDERGDPCEPGEIGRVLLTNLYNVTMPFIRYEIRDRAARVAETVCECGFRGMSITRLDGREEDFFVLPDGREITPREANDIIYSLLPEDAMGNDLFRVIERFQVIQEAVDRVVVRIAPGPEFEPALLDGLDASARRFHPDLEARLELLTYEEMEPVGKFRDVISHVPRPPEDPQRGADS